MKYAGAELQVFATATHWKRYWTSQVSPYVRGTVLEVGAGIGTNTRYLLNELVMRWICLEPDRDMVATLRVSLPALPLSARCEIQTGTLATLRMDDVFDTILYIDVLEHIEDDAAELIRAAAHLRAGGVLVILAPAHQWLYSAFDRSIGHHRRYTAYTLAAAGPTNLKQETIRYLDSAGLLASLANHLFLRQSTPTARQIGLWDRWLVSLSRILDPLTRYKFGKSILAIWRKNGLGEAGQGVGCVS